MFKTIAITAFLITFAALLVHSIVSSLRVKHPAAQKGLIRKLVHLFTLIFLEQRLSLLGVARKLVYLLALLCFVVLGFTGFYPLLALDKHIYGYLLMVHATFAPVFAVCLAVLAVMAAGSCRLDKSDWPWLQKLLRSVTRLKIVIEPPPANRMLIRKVAFWLVVFLALPLILSVILSMFRFFGTDWQNFLLAIHRYTAIAFAVVVIIHTYLMVRAHLRQ
jgi:cytochrome b subunit of formate dehydrogenase